MCCFCIEDSQSLTMDVWVLIELDEGRGCFLATMTGIISFLTLVWQGDESSTWHRPVDSSQFKWGLAPGNCWYIEGQDHWTASFSNAVHDAGFLCIIWLCRVPWPWSGGEVHVHHGRWTFSSGHHFCLYNLTISSSLVCYFSIQSSCVPSSLGSEVLCPLCIRFWCHPPID